MLLQEEVERLGKGTFARRTEELVAKIIERSMLAADDAQGLKYIAVDMSRGRKGLGELGNGRRGKPVHVGGRIPKPRMRKNLRHLTMKIRHLL